MTDHEQIEAAYGGLLDATEGLSEQGINTANMARATAMFLAELAFDCAPSPEHATHLILAAINTRLEKNIEEQAQ